MIECHTSGFPILFPLLPQVIGQPGVIVADWLRILFCGQSWKRIEVAEEPGEGLGPLRDFSNSLLLMAKSASPIRVNICALHREILMLVSRAVRTPRKLRSILVPGKAR